MMKYKVQYTYKKGIDKLVDFYPNSFNSKNIILLKKMENYENKINYRDLSYKSLFTEEDITRFYDIKFQEKYGTLYNLLNHFVNR